MKKKFRNIISLIMVFLHMILSHFLWPNLLTWWAQRVLYF